MTTLREAHAHIAAHGREMSQLNLADCSTKSECLDTLEREAARLDAAREPGWLIANAVRIDAWPEATWPTMAELDRVCPHCPCMLQSFDHHACAVNALAFTSSGFSRESADPPDGRIVRDQNGEPTGLLLEGAYAAARRAVPEPSALQWRRFVKAGLDDLAAHGFREVHDLLSQRWLGPMLAEMQDDLPVSVWLYPLLKDVESVAERRTSWESPRVRLAGAKVFADGTLNSRTAWMLAPYADALPGLERGQPMVTPAELDRALTLCRQLGIGLAVHAIGDAAVRATLDAYRRQASREQPANFPALRIEHAEIIDAADVPRFAELGIVCSVQPCHLLYDIEALQRGLPHRLDRVLPLRELIEAGCRPGELLWFGSDVPIVRPHPADSIQAAVHRRRTSSGPAIAPGQAITEAQAWRAFESA
jgi:predicted amidohydrolase YtcJ